jgi:hypothetical protein
VLVDVRAYQFRWSPWPHERAYLLPRDERFGWIAREDSVVVECQGPRESQHTCWPNLRPCPQRQAVQRRWLKSASSVCGVEITAPMLSPEDLKELALRPRAMADQVVGYVEHI